MFEKNPFFEGQASFPLTSDQGATIAVTVLFLAFILLAAYHFRIGSPGPRRSTFHKGLSYAKRSKPALPRQPEPARLSQSPGNSVDMLRRCSVATKRLMSREQAGVHALIEPFARERGLLLCSEVSLSAIFAVHHRDKDIAYGGFASIRQKYLDLLLTDARHRPLCGIEYHGTGHWQGNAKQRDFVKAEAFRLAGLPLLVVAHGYDPAAFLGRLDTALGGISATGSMDAAERMAS